MALSSTPQPRSLSSLQRLVAIGHWLFGAAATGLGFQPPQQQPSPPTIGAQPFSGIVSRRRRGLWGRHRENG